MGRQIGRFRIRGTLIQLGMLPVSGATFYVPRSPGLRRLRTWLVVAAGPASNALVCLALWPWVRVPGSVQASFGIGGYLPFTLFVANSFRLLNLLPFKTRRPPYSDGLGLVLIPFLPLPAFEELAAAVFELRGKEALEEGRYEDALRVFDQGLARFPDSWMLKHDRAVALVGMGRHDEARRKLELLLERPEAKGPVRCLIQSNMAWSILLSSDNDDDLSLADRLSAAAFEELRRIPAVIGTRGAVLARRGRYERSIPLIEKAIDRATLAESRAHNAAWLALAHAGAGNPRRSSYYLALCRQLDPRCASLPVVEPLVAQLTAAPAPATDTLET